MGFSHIHCPGSQVCAFEVIPTVPYYYEPNCHSGMLGCKADGVHDECRFCGAGTFESIRCPRPLENWEICRSTLGHRSVSYFWDDSWEAGMLRRRHSCAVPLLRWWELYRSPVPRDSFE